jgi:membrane fusion protein (multidrug efflux system)
MAVYLSFVKNKILMKRIVMLIGLYVLLFNTSCENHKNHKEAGALFLVTNPLKSDTLTIREYVCQVRSIQHIELRAMERGYLQKIFVDEGQLVKKGQLMFQILPLLYNAERQKAQAEANFAQIEYENTKMLADSNIVSKNELAMAKAKFDKANAELALAQVHLGFTEIRAPFDGIMDRFHVRLGSLIEEGELLTTLSDNSKMWVYFNVPEAEYLDYKTNMTNDKDTKVNLLMANNQLFEEPGKIETIEADFNNETGNIAFRAVFNNPKGLLRHGETGNIQMPMFFKNALIIPQKATFEILEKKYVFLVDKDSVVKQREITIAAEMPDLYVVQDGLGEKDKILVEGLRKVRDKEKIGYEYANAKTVIGQLRVYAE